MARKQTRRSVSVSAEVYLALRNYCEENGVSMSGTVEKLCRDYLDIPNRKTAERRKMIAESAGNVRMM